MLFYTIGLCAYISFGAFVVQQFYSSTKRTWRRKEAIGFVLKNDKKTGVGKVGNREKNKHAMCKKGVFGALERVKKGFFRLKH